jgi:hypothetical protein
MPFFISAYRRRTKSINPLTLNVINKVLFNVALSTGERPVPLAAMQNTVHIFATHSDELKEIPATVSTIWNLLEGSFYNKVFS